MLLKYYKNKIFPYGHRAWNRRRIHVIYDVEYTLILRRKWRFSALLDLILIPRRKFHVSSTLNLRRSNVESTFHWRTLYKISISGSNTFITPLPLQIPPPCLSPLLPNLFLPYTYANNLTDLTRFNYNAALLACIPEVSTTFYHER